MARKPVETIVMNNFKEHAYGTTCFRIFLFVGHSNRHNHLAQYQVGQEVARKPVDHFVGVNKMVYRCRTETPFACNSVPRQAQLIEYQRQQNNVRQLRIINPNVYTYKKAADNSQRLFCCSFAIFSMPKPLCNK